MINKDKPLLKWLSLCIMVMLYVGFFLNLIPTTILPMIGMVAFIPVVLNTYYELLNRDNRRDNYYLIGIITAITVFTILTVVPNLGTLSLISMNIDVGLVFSMYAGLHWYISTYHSLKRIFNKLEIL